MSITHRYAFNPAGLLVDCLRLTDANRDVFKCPSCNAPLVLVLPTQAITAQSAPGREVGR